MDDKAARDVPQASPSWLFSRSVSNMHHMYGGHLWAACSSSTVAACCAQWLSLALVTLRSSAYAMLVHCLISTARRTVACASVMANRGASFVSTTVGS